MTKCKITVLPDEFYELPNLEYLYLTDKKIFISDKICQMKIKELFVKKKKLSKNINECLKQKIHRYQLNNICSMGIY